ncbi:MAG: hypothetical protein RL071_2879 [Pseudomonadota bacterium]|jgi:hypothetical protein
MITPLIAIVVGFVLGCSGEAPAPPASKEATPTLQVDPSDTPGSVIIPTGQVVASPVQGTAVSLEALTGALPELSALAPADRDLLLHVLNVVPAPCEACEGTSLARCALSMPSACERLPGLVQRSLRLAGQGVTKDRLEAAVSYPDVWVKIPEQGRPVDPPTPGLTRLEVWIDPSGPMLGATVSTIDQLDLSTAGLVFRLLPEADDALADDVARATIAMEAQGKLEAFLRAVLAWKEQRRTLPGASAELSTEGLAEVIVNVPGVDLARLERDRAAPATAARIAEDRALAAQIGVRSLPTVFVNGYRLRGAQSALAVQRLLTLELLDHPAALNNPTAPPPTVPKAP